MCQANEISYHLPFTSDSSLANGVCTSSRPQAAVRRAGFRSIPVRSASRCPGTGLALIPAAAEGACYFQTVTTGG
jgi:hypothetical protein